MEVKREPTLKSRILAAFLSGLFVGFLLASLLDDFRMRGYLRPGDTVFIHSDGTCQVGGKYWKADKEGMCHMKDMPR